MDFSNGAGTVPQESRRRRPSAALVLALALTGVTITGAAPSPGSGAADKVRATMQSAVAEAPQVAVRLSQLRAEVATVRSTTGAGNPVLTWQTEGIGGGFQRNLNSTDNLRLSMPFIRPWQLATIRGLKEASEQWLETGQRATALEVAGLAGQRWLDLAAVIAKVQLAEIRVERLDQALLIQRKRFELGEISGSERRQIELQQAKESAILRQTQALASVLRQELELLAPGGFPGPVVGDLAGLVASSATPQSLSTEHLLEQAPYLQFAKTGAQVARLQAKQQRGAAWGQPEVEVEWKRVPDLDVIEGFDSFGFRLAVPLPVGKKGRQQLRASEQSANAAAAEQDLTQQRLLTRLQAARETALGAEAALDALAPSVAAVDVTGHSLSEQFRLGAISYLVYLDGFSRLDEVIQKAIEARHELLVARLELASIVGTDVYFPLPDLESGGES